MTIAVESYALGVVLDFDMQRWVEACFGQAGLKDMQRQVRVVEQPQYSILNRSNSTMYITYTCDPVVHIASDKPWGSHPDSPMFETSVVAIKAIMAPLPSIVQPARKQRIQPTCITTWCCCLDSLSSAAGLLFLWIKACCSYLITLQLFLYISNDVHTPCFIVYIAS